MDKKYKEVILTVFSILLLVLGIVFSGLEIYRHSWLMINATKADVTNSLQLTKTILDTLQADQPYKENGTK